MKKWSEFLEGRCWPGYKPKPGKKAYSPGSCVKEDLRQWFDPDHPKGGWKRINSKGEAIGPCAREPGEAKPKCMSNEKRGSLSKKERASAVSAKRRHDPNPERKGQPINVSNFGKGKISENMENLDEKNVPTSPEKWAQAKSQAKAKFDVYPSAYANGWASKKYKEMGGGWKSVSEESEVVDEAAKGTLHRVRYSHDDSSGNGIASGNLSLHAPDKESASRYAESDLKKRGKKNIKIHAVTPQKSSIKESEVVQEGRPSQRHPLEGHEYHKKSDEALIHIAKDAHAAAEAMKSHNTTAENKYRDQANDSATVRYFRKKNGMPEWYKKKYGHIKEAKEKTEYDYEGDMARGQLQSIINNAQRVHDMLKDNDNLPEWVQSKITLAEDYISTVANYMMSEVDEEVESIEEADALLARTGMNSAHKFPRAGQTNLKNIPAMNTPGNSKETDDYAEKRRGDRAKQLKPAIKAALGTHGPKGKLPEEVEPIEELSRETLLQYTTKALPWSVTHKMIASGARQDLNFSKAKHHSMIAKKREDGIKKANARLKKDSEKNYYKDHWKANRGYYGPELPLQKEEVSKTSDATTSAEIGTPAQLSLKVTPKKLETPVYESRQMQIVREALADAKKKDAAKKKEKKVNPAGDDKFQAEPELTSSITKNT